MLAKADVAIVGGGVIGCAVAYYLAKAGVRVALAESGAIGGGASAANSGAIAMATKKPGFALDLAMASQRLYPGLSAELGMDVEYAVQGNLIVAESESETIHLEHLAREQQAAGVPAEIVSAERCRQINPLLDGGVLSGLYCPTDAQVNPFKVTQAYALAAQKLGAEVVTGAHVTSIEARSGRVTALETSRGRIEADWVVNAAGAHAADIGAMLGAAHAVKPRRGQIIVLEATRDMPRPRVAAAGQLTAKHGGGPARSPTNVALSYLSRPQSGTVLLGSTNEFVGFDTRTTRAALGDIARYARRLMPRLGGFHAIRAWAGLRPYSAEGPLLGNAGGPAGYVVAIGHGGDGVALSPITGVYIADYVAREAKGPDIRAFLKQPRP